MTDSKGQRVAGPDRRRTSRSSRTASPRRSPTSTPSPAASSSSRTARPWISAARRRQPRFPRDVKAHYVFYVDNLNIQPMNRNRMFKRLKEFVAQVVGPNAEGMVVTFNRSLKVRRQFTSDVERSARSARPDRARERRRDDGEGRVEGRARQDRRAPRHRTRRSAPSGCTPSRCATTSSSRSTRSSRRSTAWRGCRGARACSTCRRACRPPPATSSSTSSARSSRTPRRR